MFVCFFASQPKLEAVGRGWGAGRVRRKIKIQRKSDWQIGIQRERVRERQGTLGKWGGGGRIW